MYCLYCNYCNYCSLLVHSIFHGSYIAGSFDEGSTRKESAGYVDVGAMVVVLEEVACMDDCDNDGMDNMSMIPLPTCSRSSRMFSCAVRMKLGLGPSSRTLLLAPEKDLLRE